MEAYNKFYEVVKTYGLNLVSQFKNGSDTHHLYTYQEFYIECIFNRSSISFTWSHENRLWTYDLNETIMTIRNINRSFILKQLI